jgi:hypothetical protein
MSFPEIEALYELGTYGPIIPMLRRRKERDAIIALVSRGYASLSWRRATITRDGEIALREVLRFID